MRGATTKMKTLPPIVILVRAEPAEHHVFLTVPVLTPGVRVHLPQVKDIASCSALTEVITYYPTNVV